MNNEKVISEIQKYQRFLQQIKLQKQNLSIKKDESSNAIDELDKTNKSYKLIGDVLIEKDSQSLKKEISSRIDNINEQLESLNRNEEKIQNKLSKLQKDLRNVDDNN